MGLLLLHIRLPVIPLSQAEQTHRDAAMTLEIGEESQSFSAIGLRLTIVALPEAYTPSTSSASARASGAMPRLRWVNPASSQRLPSARYPRSRQKPWSAVTQARASCAAIVVKQPLQHPSQVAEIQFQAITCEP